MTDDLGEFGKAGFRAYSLKGDGWTIVLSRVNKIDLKPEGLFTVFALDAPGGFKDLGGLLFSRHCGLFGGTNLKGVAADCVARLGRDDVQVWGRRLDYLAQRVVLDGATGTERDFTGLPAKPTAPAFVFEKRVRVGRTISLFGPGSAGKTTIADALLVSALTGVEIIPTWRPLRPFRVGLLDWDEGDEETEVRLHAICTAAGLSLGDWGYHYKHLTRPLADSADEVGRWILQWEIELLCVSPVNRALRSSSGDLAGPVYELYEVLSEFGTTNLLIDHVTGQNIGNKLASREYGSAAKQFNARGSYSVYEQSAEPGKRVVVIRNPKPPALSPARPPQAVRIEFEPPWPDEAEAYDRITFSPDVVVEDKPAVTLRENQAEKLVRILSEQGPMSATELATIGGFDVKRIRKIADKARAAKIATVRYNSDGLYSIEEDDGALGL
jgi:hypothetical protein